MKATILFNVLFLIAGHAALASNNPADIIPLLKTSKLSLLQGIEYAERTSGVAISAKFEAEDGKLSLSVYTVPEGLKAPAEKATLTEISGDAGVSPFKGSAEVFADKEHIARASTHLALFQLSRLSLKEVIGRALSVRSGTPIDVRNPTVENHRAIADVVIADEDGDSDTVRVDLLTGRATLE